MTTVAEYLRKGLQDLNIVGGKITDTVIDGDCLGLVVHVEDGDAYILWVTKDPEGNGPGFLEVEEF